MFAHMIKIDFFDIDNTLDQTITDNFIRVHELV